MRGCLSFGFIRSFKQIKFLGNVGIIMKRMQLTEENPLIRREYEKINIKEEILDETKEDCFIFFSDNGFYSIEDGQRDFVEKVVKENHYEWTSLAQNELIREKAGKIIGVRDVYMTWYIKGINPKVNSVDKLIDLLCEKTSGYKITTVGTSAGGI